MKKHLGNLLVASILALSAAADVSANLMLRRPASDTATIGIHLSHPEFEGSSYKIRTGSLELDFRVPVSHSVAIAGQLPLGFSDRRGSTYDGTVLGNIGLGLEFLPSRSGRSRTSITFLAQLPTSAQFETGPSYEGDDEAAKYYALFAGYSADLYDFARFQPYWWSLYGNISQQYNFTSGQLGGELGPTILMPREGGDTELLMHYGVSGGLGTKTFLVTAELTGLFLVTEDTQEFSDRFDHFVALGIELPGVIGRPALFFQKALDEEFERLNGAFHLRVEFPVGQAKP